MEAEKLIAMANQIAAYFKVYPEADAVTGVRDHIVAFWTPGMRRTLVAHLDESTTGVEHLVVTAMMTRKEGESPIKKEVEGPRPAW